MRPELIDSVSFAELDTLLRQAQDPASVPVEQRLTPERVAEINGLINAANWLVFAMLDVDQENAPSSTALKRFLDQRADSLRDKKLVVFAFNAPYFLSDTEIGKLTAYYGLYSKVAPFLETAVRTLFRELPPSGRSPVSVAGVNYDLSRQLEPDPSRRFPLALLLPSDDGGEPRPIAGDATTIDVAVGDIITLQAGPIYDRNNHIVPDGAPVEFRFQDQQAGIELPRRQETTTNGRAVTQLTIERAGSLQLSASAGEGAASDVLLLTVGGETGASLATATPTTTPTASPTPPPTETPTPAPTATPGPATLTPPTFGGAIANLAPWGQTARADVVLFFFAILANALAAGLYYTFTRNNHAPRPLLTRGVLLSVVGAMTAYLLYALGLLPASDWLWRHLGYVSVLAVVFVGGLLPFLIDRFPLQPRA